MSQSLRASGQAAKASGIEEMRAAKEIADKRVENRLQNKKASVPLIVEGQGEHLAGWALGCEGMKQRGERKVEVGGQKMGPGSGPGDANGPSQ